MRKDFLCLNAFLIISCDSKIKWTFPSNAIHALFSADPRMSPRLNIAVGLRDEFIEEVIFEEWLCQADKGSAGTLAEETECYLYGGRRKHGTLGPSK
jgi:hypothetical protein